jgi:hypothetical protein
MSTRAHRQDGRDPCAYLLQLVETGFTNLVVSPKEVVAELVVVARVLQLHGLLCND